MEEHQPSQACLARALGPAGRTTFHLYATTIPRPPGDGHTDAESFYRALQRITKLPQDAHLEQAGVEISAATNGQEATNRSRRRHPASPGRSLIRTWLSRDP